MNSMVTIKKLPYDKLEIKLNKGSKRDLRAILKDHGSITAWHEMLESYLCNGWELMDGEIALCSNEFMISDDVEYKSEEEEKSLNVGETRFKHIGRVYYYPYYETKCPIQYLLGHNKLVLDSVA